MKKSPPLLYFFFNMCKGGRLPHLEEYCNTSFFVKKLCMLCFRNSLYFRQYGCIQQDAGEGPYSLSRCVRLVHADCVERCGPGVWESQTGAKCVFLRLTIDFGGGPGGLRSGTPVSIGIQLGIQRALCVLHAVYK